MCNKKRYGPSEIYLDLAEKDHWILIEDIPYLIKSKILEIIDEGSVKIYRKKNGRTEVTSFRFIENENFTAFKMIPGKSRLEEERCHS